MRTEADRWTGALLHGWVELLTLFGMLAVALLLIGWCWNRGLRSSDRLGVLPWQLLITAYALVLVLRYFKEGLWPSIIIAVGVALAGLLGRGNQHNGLWVPVMLLAALLGLGLNLSFLVLTLLIMLVLLFSAGRGR